ncbi:SNARE associated Golgi family protein [Serratia symbiotica]|nr:SNARE associated Golgi family protein [Serratia symbiotica]
MTFNTVINMVSELVHQHASWVSPIIFFLAFGESLAFLSVLLPTTLILLSVGMLINKSGLDFWAIWSAAAVGAFFGDWVSYWIGHHYQSQVVQIWPLSRNPQILIRGHAFFERWGVLGIFIGRFFGPLRAVVPLISGLCGMPQGHFQLANITSAMIWAFAMLAPGAWNIN